MIFNDCRLSDYWTDKTLKQSHKSEPYNPNIAHVFYLSGHVESWGRGIDKICRSCTMHGIPLPEYDVQTEEICVTFKTSDEYLNGDKGITGIPKDSQRVPKEVPKEISDSVRRTYDAVAENPRLTIKELSEKLGISDRTIKKHIAYLKEESLIERVGGKTHGHWQVKPIK
ncbi:MAG: HTH domain-containing protein [bacterium]|nr:HTH domain-containing protein [Candidatus Limimorpha caballi]